MGWDAGAGARAVVTRRRVQFLPFLCRADWALGQVGRSADAIDLFGRSIQLKPDENSCKYMSVAPRLLHAACQRSPLASSHLSARTLRSALLSMRARRNLGQLMAGHECLAHFNKGMELMYRELAEAAQKACPPLSSRCPHLCCSCSHLCCSCPRLWWR
eukprot:1268611-Rhodomonas_salina.1